MDIFDRLIFVMMFLILLIFQTWGLIQIDNSIEALKKESVTIPMTGNYRIWNKDKTNFFEIHLKAGQVVEEK